MIWKGFQRIYFDFFQKNFVVLFCFVISFEYAIIVCILGSWIGGGILIIENVKTGKWLKNYIFPC